MGLVIIFTGVVKREYASALKALSSMFLGGAIVLIFISLYFVANSAFTDFVTAVFRYNFSYSNFMGFNSLLKNVFWIFEQLPFYMYLSLFGWVFLTIKIFREKNFISRSQLLLVVLLGFVVELLFYNLSGKNYGHYFLSLLPYVCLVSGYFLSEFFTSKALKRIFGSENLIEIISITSLMLLITAQGFKTTSSVNTIFSEKIEQQRLLSEVEKYISKDDYLLIWGAETPINYLLDVPAPTRFPYQYPLMNCDFIDKTDALDFVKDLEMYSPVIIDSSATNPEIISINSGKQKGCEQINPIFTYIEREYVVSDQMSNGWIVYKPVRQ
jgi:hypothetical protein